MAMGKKGTSQYLDKLRTKYPGFGSHFDLISHREAWVIIERLKGRTLASIGKDLCITRERTMEIEGHGCRILIRHMAHKRR